MDGKIWVEGRRFSEKAFAPLNVCPASAVGWVRFAIEVEELKLPSKSKVELGLIPANCRIQNASQGNERVNVPWGLLHEGCQSPAGENDFC